VWIRNVNMGECR